MSEMKMNSPNEVLDGKKYYCAMLGNNNAIPPNEFKLLEGYKAMMPNGKTHILREEGNRPFSCWIDMGESSNLWQSTKIEAMWAYLEAMKTYHREQVSKIELSVYKFVDSLVDKMEEIV